MRRSIVVALLIVLAAGLSLLVPQVRNGLRAVLRPEPPAPITPLPIIVAQPPTRQPVSEPTQPPTATATLPSLRTTEARQTLPPTPSPTPTPLPTPSPTPGPVEINGRVYAAYIPASSKEQQFFRYSCEFDAAWVILATYGIDAPFEEMLAAIGTDESVEPYIEETTDGFLIHGGDIGSSFSGDYTDNFLARSTGTAFRKVFAHYGLAAEPVHDRAGVEAALRSGALVWMKTTVDFKPWRPATWVTPEGTTYSTVLGNDHAVVVIGFNEEVVVIRDVLGPTSSNWERPYEYEVSWETFLASWGAQANDGLAVLAHTLAP
jgi:hypothetical protein